ncbi:alcohol dehydrogenase catalytic domain-containing protein [Pseudomonas amygdali]|uniref:alcohol dehydrogenase catalytic domain-containing protein n=1 Tax=Pseudomonas amygdali TaxID=47877 RepID=UPI001FB7B0C0|nr:zinc-binding dehydrogenase [Pseudomonas amygdali]UPT36774.1 zinc-binding dehydrogenase [Pseudomonas amygdali pv. loropetali]
MSTMNAIQVPAPGEPMELVQIPVPTPEVDQVLIRVEACGVCYGESKIIEGWASSYPRIPGHEVVGVIEKLGTGAGKWKVGQRVGIGWDGGHSCGHHQTTALTMNGGYAEYMVANADALILIPDELSSEQAAPILCAGETVFSALRNSVARAGDVVAVSGIGGLGHLAIQYAKKIGLYVVAISSSKDKENLARELGAHQFIDASTEDVAAKLKELGGAKVIVATAPDGKTISGLIGGLGTDAELIIAAVSSDDLGLTAMDFLKGPNTIRGTFTGKTKELEAALRFSVLADVRPLIEVFPLERAKEAYDKMMAAKTRFRAVISMSA